MPNSRHQRVPDSNVLDLRKLLEEQSTTVERPRRSAGWIGRGRQRQRRSELVHQPARPAIAWSMLGRELGKFLVALIVVGLPVLGIVGGVRMVRAAGETEQLARHGITQLQQGGQAIVAYDSVAADRAFTAAAATFQQAERTIRSSVWSQTRMASRLPVVGKKFQTGLAAVSAASDIALAGKTLSSSLTGVKPDNTGLSIESQGVIEGSVGVLGPMLRQPQSFRRGLEQLIQALNELSLIDPNAVPSAYAESVRTWQRLQPLMTEPNGRGEDLADFLTAMFAGDETKEWLIVFENHDELRPTGGFIGTYLLVKFEKGIFKVLDAPVTGPFDLTAQIPQTTLPPQPILAVAPYWTFQDANWFLDVPTSSNFLLDFYEQARGFKPDGIIYITPGVIESLLRITGPLRPDGYGVDITADNFVRATEEQVEFKYNKALNNPKEFLIDLVPTLITALTKLDATEGMLTAGVALQHADQADLLFYSGDKVTQQAIESLGWSGKLLTAPDDYLATVTTNLGGGKTDRVIDESVAVTVHPESRGLVHTVAITRKHTGVSGDPLAGLTNRSFLRVYAPPSAQLITVQGASPTQGLFQTPKEGANDSDKLLEAEGTVLLDQTGAVRITGESGRKTFGAWSILPPGTTQTVTFIYSTPLPKGTTWSLVWQKQPGAPRRDWSLTYVPGDRESVREVIGGGRREKQNAVWQTNSDRSQSFGVVVSKK